VRAVAASRGLHHAGVMEKTRGHELRPSSASANHHCRAETNAPETEGKSHGPAAGLSGIASSDHHAGALRQVDELMEEFGLGKVPQESRKSVKVTLPQPTRMGLPKESECLLSIDTTAQSTPLKESSEEFKPWLAAPHPKPRIPISFIASQRGSGVAKTLSARRRSVGFGSRDKPERHRISLIAESDYTKCAEGLCKWLEGDENRALPSYVGPFSPQYTTPTPVLIQSEDINTLWGSGHDPMRHSAQQHETRRPRRSVSQNALQRPLTGHLPFPALHNELKRNKMGSRFGQPELQQGKGTQICA